MPDAGSGFTFISVARRGLAARIRSATDPQRAVTLPVTVQVNARSHVALDIELYGPGDVVGIDPRAIIRTDPREHTNDFEPNYFAQIEFDAPDFPWLFTSDAPSAQNGSLTPWTVLVVVERDNAVLTANVATPLPTLTCPISELPDLGEAWAWSHAQLIGTHAPSDIVAHIMGDPSLNLSRIICPRRLEANRRYLACLVPAFRAGVQAGLGEAVTSGPREPAWQRDGSAADTRITLPVYYQWDFGTGAAGDFKSMVRRLAPATLPSDVGLRSVDVSHPGLGLPAAGLELGAEAPLWGPNTRPTDWPDSDRRPFQAALNAFLGNSQPAAAGAQSVIAPPVYGAVLAGETALGGASPAWLRDLNLDPRHRVAASLGTLVVQKQQEALVASAWQQYGEIRRANQLLRQAQLARAAAFRLHQRRLASLPPGMLVQVTAPVHTRVRAGAAATLYRRVRESALSDTPLTAAFRRLLRPQGPVRRRLMPAGARVPTSLVRRLASREIAAAPPRPTPRGLVSFGNITANAVRTAAVPPSRSRRPDFDVFKSAALQHLQDLEADAVVDTTPAPPPLDLPAARSTLLDALDPHVTIPSAVRTRIRVLDAVWDRPDPLAPLIVAPSFSQPMFDALRDIAPDLVLPGLDRVPTNSVVVAKPNPRFIEAYMVGLNHEMARELLWREFPTDPGHTYFTRFWDLVTPGAAPDIPPISQWSRVLGEHMTGVTSESLLVLLLRGELLRRYPGVVIYAVEAQRTGDRRPGSQRMMPLLRERIEPDILLAGYNLSVEQVRGSATHPGWYFVIQEQPTSPRFGVDEGSDAAAISSVVASSGAAGSARVAALTWRQPVRVAIHALSLLPPEA